MMRKLAAQQAKRFRLLIDLLLDDADSALVPRGHRVHGVLYLTLDTVDGDGHFLADN